MEIVELDEARRQLEAFVGGRLKNLDPDSVGERLPGLQWRRLSPEDVADDATAARLLALAPADRDEEMLIVTDASFMDARGAFLVKASEFVAFMPAHLERYGERVFSGGDVIIWMPSSKRLWLFHHEGVFAAAPLPGD